MEWKIGLEFNKSYKLTNEMIVGYAHVSLDKNPVHLDDEYAKTTIFKKRIAHGMLLGGLISSILGNDFPGNGTIYLNQNLNFKKPVFLNDTIDILIKVIEINPKGWLTLETNCYSKGNLVIEGDALVIPPKEESHDK